ncbi:MAG: hypothetical protein B5766_02520 [Candidatus Lumbricidophila eiseniae]|uniref:Uncharacterized protein n=1 Tax=Candidatus Lumbricidiphila eiseniae TaxID=1969409 RepID=A0A2A6FT36_9MICO|nr:MAG: hypothetical protein B5766_02520 [Candidatus Lumbricidophila eiseniae]
MPEFFNLTEEGAALSGSPGSLATTTGLGAVVKIRTASMTTSTAPPPHAAMTRFGIGAPGLTLSSFFLSRVLSPTNPSPGKQRGLSFLQRVSHPGHQRGRLVWGGDHPRWCVEFVALWQRFVIALCR